MKRLRTWTLAALPLASVLALSGCGAGGSGADTTETAANGSAVDNPYGHVHGMTVVPDTDQVLLATHNGLFDPADQSSERIGPPIDLMGFTASEDGTLYASGHPHPDAGIPEPAGLLRSSDGGNTWEMVSRQGESDFHALTTADGSIVAFDGQLRTSPDGQSWDPVATDLAPFALAGSRSGAVLATTEQGLWRSTDAGQTWDEPASGPVLLTAAFANEDTVVGVAPDGTVHTSEDAGQDWATGGSIRAAPAAVTAQQNGDGNLEVWIATNDGTVMHSTDDAHTFDPMN